MIGDFVRLDEVNDRKNVKQTIYIEGIQKSEFIKAGFFSLNNQSAVDDGRAYQIHTKAEDKKTKQGW